MHSSERQMPPSLKQLAQRQCIRLASNIVDIGCARYEIVEPILRRLNGRQLAEIESRCPSVRKHSDDLWRLLIQREFPERALPPPPYRNAYYTLCQDKETQMVAARERLRANQRQYEAQKEASTVVALAEVPARARHDMPLNSSVSSYRSKTMQQVARQMRSSNMRRPPPALSLHQSRNTKPPRPVPVAVGSRQGSPTRTVHSSSPATPQRPPPSKRRKVSSIFMPSR